MDRSQKKRDTKREQTGKRKRHLEKNDSEGDKSTCSTVVSVNDTADSCEVPDKNEAREWERMEVDSKRKEVTEFDIKGIMKKWIE